MGENGRYRENVEKMAAEIKKHQERAGKPVTSVAAKDQAAAVARDTDNKRDAGALRNKRHRAPKAAPDTGTATGRIFVDLGKKG